MKYALRTSIVFRSPSPDQMLQSKQSSSFPIRDPDDPTQEFVIDPNCGSLRLQIRKTGYRLNTWRYPEDAHGDLIPSFVVEAFRDLCEERG